MPEILALLSGTFYGLLIGIIPGAGATTGLIFLFSFITLFPDPYLAVIFVMAVVAASTTGDTYTGVLLGIPGANSAAATMIDGFPLALQGKATYAISAAVTTSTINGLLWGSLTFFLLPWYTNLILIFGVPELWAFTMLALATVTFISNKWWVRGLIALAAGIFIGMIGVDPNTNADRWTGDWKYLGAGVQLLPMIAGLFAIPELIDGLARRRNTADSTIPNGRQTLDGIKAATKNPDVPFGKGNIRGVIGPEGANNAQKATSMIPTVLFGIPGAPFAAIIIGLFAYLDFELGTVDLAMDTKFFDSMLFGFMMATILVAILCILLTKYIAKIANVPYKYYFPLLLAFIVLACVQYTGGWEDYAILIVCSVIGISAKKFKFSRPALLFGFILAERIESLSIQMYGLYTFDRLLTRPIFWTLIGTIIIVLVWGLSKRNKLEYA